MKSLQQLFVEHYIHAADENEIVTWACETISSDTLRSNDQLLIEIAALKPGISDDEKKVDRFFNEFFFREFPDFEIRKAENEKIARQSLKQICAEFLEGRVNAGKLCPMVLPLETAFDYPAWLGNLYDACDGVGDLETSKSAPHIAQEILRICDKL